MSIVTPPPDLTTDDPLQRKVCELRLQALLRRSDGLRFACLGTVDGRAWAFERRLGATDSARLSAISSSLLALCETFAREALSSRCQYNVINAEHGVVVTVRIPSRSSRFALSLGADDSETLAMVLRYALDAAQELAVVLDARDVRSTQSSHT